METIIPEIDEIVNFYSPELIEQLARETGFVQRESKLYAWISGFFLIYREKCVNV